MAALNSLRPALGALGRNPILIILVGLFGLVQLPQLALQQANPLVAAVVSLGMSVLMVLVLPFIQGGLLGMADEALGGRTGLGTLVAEGKANYLRLLGAYLGLFAVNFVFGIVVIVAAILGGVTVFAGDEQASLATLGVVAIILLLVVFAYLVVVFLVQFYAHAIVLSGAGLVGGFKRSATLVRRNLVSVVGYSLILLVGSLLLGGIGGIASILLSPQPTGLSVPDLSMSMLAGLGIAYVVAVAVLGAFYATYSVAFYRSIEDTTSKL